MPHLGFASSPAARPLSRLDQKAAGSLSYTGMEDIRSWCTSSQVGRIMVRGLRCLLDFIPRLSCSYLSTAVDRHLHRVWRDSPSGETMLTLRHLCTVVRQRLRPKAIKFGAVSPWKENERETNFHSSYQLKRLSIPTPNRFTGTVEYLSWRAHVDTSSRCFHFPGKTFLGDSLEVVYASDQDPKAGIQCLIGHLCGLVSVRECQIHWPLADRQRVSQA